MPVKNLIKDKRQVLNPEKISTTTQAPRAPQRSRRHWLRGWGAHPRWLQAGARRGCWHGPEVCGATVPLSAARETMNKPQGEAMLPPRFTAGVAGAGEQARAVSTRPPAGPGAGAPAAPVLLQRPVPGAPHAWHTRPASNKLQKNDLEKGIQSSNPLDFSILCSVVLFPKDEDYVLFVCLFSILAAE